MALLQNISNQNSNIIYPNPVVNTLNLSIQTRKINEEATLEIIDITGKKVVCENYKIDNTKPVSFDVSQLSPGIYLVRMKVENNTETLKLIKQ